ncbi:MAG: twin-arginine translocation signal domain-containing protein [Rhodospirillum sp.]|nr:twin-arginine translocation signal domain-containing protein [Rhodospirillum sp.]MCF8489424.1 twin-arginine translocation signal domain-containing protein [Rhodospirillum sp.]MCF8501637.1 twin-arginine translocation signal domain-containing protein [Rhodospirillum sp.]
MDRRKFIGGLGAAGAAGVVGLASSFPKPAIAQSMPTLHWRMQSAFPKGSIRVS